jgi:hypothetical protein
MAGMAAAPAAALGQQYTPPDTVWPFPLYSNRPDDGGFFAFGEFVYFNQTNPLQHQLIAVRGIKDVFGDITGTTGKFIGNNPPTPALFADDAGGPGSFQPGFTAGLGWRFANGVSIEASWLHLVTARYDGIATLFPPTLNAGANQAESFLFANVFNFPADFVGPPDKLFSLLTGDITGNIGIWNGASIMQVTFFQRFDEYNLTGRIPVYQDDCWRTYGLIGPRLSWIWERFRWRTTSADFLGESSPADVAVYSNVVSNRMYGVHAGCGTECRTGDTPIGTFAVSVDTEVAGMVDLVKENASYERGDRQISAKRARQQFKLVPEIQANVNAWWYPIEGVQLRVGYDLMGFFNTVSSPNPVSFNFGGLDPAWVSQTRWFNGLNTGIAFIF